MFQKAPVSLSAMKKRTQKLKVHSCYRKFSSKSDFEVIRFSLLFYVLFIIYILFDLWSKVSPLKRKRGRFGARFEGDGSDLVSFSSLN